MASGRGAAHPERVYLTIRKGSEARGCRRPPLVFQGEVASQVDAFWDAGIAAGGTDDGAPGLRDYHASYYAAFLRDPDGNRVEAVLPPRRRRPAERLAEELRALQPIPPRQLDRLGDADANAGDDIGLRRSRAYSAIGGASSGRPLCA